MSWYGDYSFWAPRVPVATKIARGRAAAKKLAATEGRQPDPIAVQGRKIAKTFWGVKWCENLERYRDLSNRLPRGATYVRNGSVADLVIEPGRVRAVVGGTEAYTVKIDIQTLKRGVWEAICRECAQAVDSLFDLLQGRFNDIVMQRLTQAEGGLFPHKTEISMTCSCPDSASVCKHIAAAFYGVAARLDQRPDLLFKLRNVDHLELIAHATDAANLDQALSSSGESLSDADLGDIFGIELESTDISSAVPGKRTPKQTSRRKAAKVSLPAKTKVDSRVQRGKQTTTEADPGRKRGPKTPPGKTTPPGKKAIAKKSVVKSKKGAAKSAANRMSREVSATASSSSRRTKSV